MSENRGVWASYGFALGRAKLFVLLYLSVQIVFAAVIVPAIGGLARLATSLSGQSALTDQDIAGFLLHPVGLFAGVMLAAVLLIAEIVGYALAVSAYYAQGEGVRPRIRNAYALVIARLPRLVWFGVLFVLRVLALIAPFAVLAGWAFARWLMEFDINYYLSHHPPELFRAGLVIGLGLLAAAALLLSRLSGWALAVHEILLGASAPGQAFARSVTAMSGHRGRIARAVAGWAMVRILAGVAMSIVVAWLANLVPVHGSGGMRIALLVVSVLSVLWVLAYVLIGAVSTGALAWLLSQEYGAPETGPTAEARPRATLPVLAATVAGGVALTAILAMTAPQPRDEVVVIAHRGGAIYRPENTMAAIEKGVADGADWIEIDVQETADGAVVVLHDSDFMKLAGVDLKIWDANLADLADIDIGSGFDPVYSNQRTPLLSEALALVRDSGGAGMLIELKYYGHDQNLEERVARIVEEAGMADRVAVMSLKYPAVEKMVALRPDWPVGVLAATALGDLAGLAGDFVALSTAMATPRRIAAAQRAGKAFFVWTVNDPFEMSRMISKGVDGLITDDPEMARRVVTFRAKLTAPQRLLLALADLVGLDAASAPAIPATD